jgi:hypothetical protein
MTFRPIASIKQASNTPHLDSPRLKDLPPQPTPPRVARIAAAISLPAASPDFHNQFTQLAPVVGRFPFELWAG